MQLTKEQLEIIKVKTGYLLVKACPGSGKTTTMAQRTLALPEDDRKLILTFNKTAATDFERKVMQADNTKVQTFHSFCYGEVRRNYKKYGYASNPSVETDLSYFDLICQANGWKRPKAWADLKLNEEVAQERYTRYDAEIAELANSQSLEDIGAEWAQAVAELKKTPVTDFDLKKAKEIELEQKFFRYNTYKAMLAIPKFLRENNIITFDYMVKFVAESKYALEVNYDHITVDEFQDVDRFQFDILKNIIDNNDLVSVAVVGDSNQMIYEWRGALQTVFSDFESLGNVTKRALSVNFRSTPEIVKSAENHIPVGMTAFRKSINKPITSIEAKPIDAVVHLYNKQLPRDFSDTIILARYNYLCFQWQVEMSKHKIPTYVLGGINFFKQAHIKMALRAKGEGQKLEGFFKSEEWLRIRIANEKDPEKLENLTQEVKFFWGLTSQEIFAMQENAQNKETGLRISTVHKVKGLEFDKVIISGVDEKFQNDTYVYYVALTRAKDELVIHRLVKKQAA